MDSENALKDEIIKIIKEQKILLEKVSAIIIHGSYFKINTADMLDRDIDVVCLIDPSVLKQRYFVIKFKKEIRFEIEFVPTNMLKTYLTNYWWWPHNWDIEMGKFVYGRFILDKQNFITSFRSKLIEYPKNIRAFLILHRLGRVINLIKKYKYAQSIYLSFEIIRAIILLLSPLRKIYPVSAVLEDHLPNEDKIKIKRLERSMDDSLALHASHFIDMEINKLLSHEKILVSELRSAQIYYPDDALGKIYILKKLNSNLVHDMSTIKLNPIWE